MKKIFACLVVVLFACVGNSQNNSYYNLSDSIKIVNKIAKYKTKYERAKKEEFPTNMKYYGNKYNNMIKKYYSKIGYNCVYDHIDWKTDINEIFHKPITNEPVKQIFIQRNLINLSGEYLMKANRLKVTSLAITLIGGGCTAIAATTIPTKEGCLHIKDNPCCSHNEWDDNCGHMSQRGKNTLCYVFGIGSGVASLAYYISSLVYEQKSASILENIKFEGTKISYYF